MANGEWLFLIIIIAWRLFADQYNETHQVNYFLSKIKPIWDIDESTRESIWSRIIEKRLPTFFHPYTFWALAILGLGMLLTPKKQNIVLYLFYVLIAAGSISFFILMFKQFKLHDYYALEMMLLPLSILFGVVMFLKNHFPQILKKWWFKGILTFFLLFNLNHSKSHLNLNYSDKFAENPHFNVSFWA